MDSQHLLTVNEVAARMRVSRGTVSNLLRDRAFPNAFRARRSGWRVPASDVEAYLQRQRVQGSDS